MTQREMENEIELLIQERLEAGQQTPMAWIVAAVVNRYPVTQNGKKAAVHTLALTQQVPVWVRKVLSRHRIDPNREKTPDPQSAFPGFTRLQHSYALDDEGSTIIPTTQMKVAQLRAKAKEYRAMGAGCYEHADELDRYADMVESGEIEQT